MEARVVENRGVEPLLHRDECAARGDLTTALGGGLLCWLDDGHQGPHWDNVDRLWWELVETLETAA